MCNIDALYSACTQSSMSLSYVVDLDSATTMGLDICDPFKISAEKQKKISTDFHIGPKSK